MLVEPVDVLVVGAGISGIAAGYHLQTACPSLSYAIVEQRERLGGTWDLFRYPGVRSDSDMQTLGFSFRPWKAERSIADGVAIRTYLNDTAREFGIDQKIRLGIQVTGAAWSSPDARWTVDAHRPTTGEALRFSCRFLFMCSGYYDYDHGYTPEFPGREQFAGRVVHPQFWPEDLDCTGKRVVVIGSGATAVTLVPALAKTAAQVTMLQRSPTWIVAMPARDPFTHFVRRHLPESLAHTVSRWRSILFGALMFQLSRRRPARVRGFLLRRLREELGPDYDIRTHFTPRYDPWQQRLCLVPDGDLFAAIRAGRAAVVTDQIDTFTAHGIRLRSGKELAADIVVTATGLVLKLLGGARVSVDGHPVEFGKTLTYKGVMFGGVPNLALAVGYTNASWTLKCELTAAWVARLLNHMATQGLVECRPRQPVGDQPTVPMLDLDAGYVRRSIQSFPKQGLKRPWRALQNYLLDIWTVGWSPIDDGVLAFRHTGDDPLGTDA